MGIFSLLLFILQHTRVYTSVDVILSNCTIFINRQMISERVVLRIEIIVSNQIAETVTFFF